MRLNGKVALITGAGSGMGRAAAVAFASEGASVALCDVKANALEETVHAVRSSGGHALGVVADVSASTEVSALVQASVAEFGKLNVLYSNAAIYWPGKGDAPVDALDELVYDRVLAVNLKGVFLCAKYAIPEMIRAGGGSIINASSLAGTRGSIGSHAYAIAKGGVISMTLSLAATYGPQNIRANAIAPGIIDTQMTRGVGLMTSPEGEAQVMAHLPLRRVGAPEEVARLALFLASDESSYLTGTVQVIDGGFSLG
jgi:NAD(P)-dependent dehydrogenase (short-subunit alcohol dehydrogenase family)